VDIPIVAMLKRRAERGAALGASLGERARAVARRDEGPDTTDAVPATTPVRLRTRMPRATRMGAASLVATLAIAVGLVALIGLRPEPGPLSASSSPSGSPVDATAATPSGPPPAAWDAISWRLVGMHEVVYGAHSSKFVVDAVPWRGGVAAIGYDIDEDRIVGRVWRSSDGSDWREVTSGEPPFDHVSLDRLFPLGDRLVITGRDRSAELGGAENDPGAPVAFESMDGEAWHPLTDIDSPWLKPSIVAADSGGGTTMVVEGTWAMDGHLWQSSDGRTWSATDLDAVLPGTIVTDLAWTGDRWLAGGVKGAPPTQAHQAWGTGAVWVSADGASWEPAGIDAPLFGIVQLAIGRSGIVAIGGRTGGGAITFSASLWRSDDGSMWTPLALENQQLVLLADGERIVAVDRRDDQRLRVRESFDGASWQEVDVRGAGQLDAEHPETLDGWAFPGSLLQPMVLTSNGIWALGREWVSSVEGVADTEAELRWFGTIGREPGSATFAPRPLPGWNDTPCEPAGQECG
jgi:hypothetical protein